MPEGPRVLFVTNFASHYRVPLFEELAGRLQIRFVFFSAGGEEYWQTHLGTSAVRARTVTVVGRQLLPKLRLNWGLLSELKRRDYDVIVKCTNGRFELPATWLYARRHGIPFVLWTGLWEHPSTLFHRFTRPLLRHIYRHADSLVVYGEHVKTYVVSEGAEPCRVFVAENAVDTVSFSRPADVGRVHAWRRKVLGGGSGRIVLSVSRLVPEKGLDVLVDALARLESQDVHLAIVGTGSEADNLAVRAAARGVPLTLLGGVPADEMPEVYDAADLVVLPSVTSRHVKELWGLACNEALIRGRCLVTTDAVGAAAGGLVIDRVTGRVVPERSVASLSDAIDELLTNTELANRLAAAGRMRVLSRGIPAMAAAFEAAVVSASRGNS